MRYLLLLLLLLLGACSSVRREPWIEAGRTRGTIEMEKAKTGFEYRYLDPVGRLLRRETRDPQRELVGGPCVTTSEFDEEGRLVETAWRDADSRLTRGSGGFAAERIAYSEDPIQGAVAECSYYDEHDAPMTLSAGYARARYRPRPDLRVAEEIVFLDLSGKPVEAKFLGRDGVARVQYANLQGVSAVRFAVLYASDGRIVDRVRVSGVTEHTWSHTY